MPGIEQGVQDRVEAFRGNPQELQKRYAINNDLMDMLALRKLVTEKEAAKRHKLRL